MTTDIDKQEPDELILLGSYAKVMENDFTSVNQFHLNNFRMQENKKGGKYYVLGVVINTNNIKQKAEELIKNDFSEEDVIDFMKTISFSNKKIYSWLITAENDPAFFDAVEYGDINPLDTVKGQIIEVYVPYYEYKGLKQNRTTIIPLFTEKQDREQAIQKALKAQRHETYFKNINEFNRYADKVKGCV